MELFIDSANIEEIKNACELGVISGVTTNPSLVAKEKQDFKEGIKKISEIIDGPISAEVISLHADEMVKEALVLAKIHENIVIKLPITSEGLKACSILSAQGIAVNMTLIFSSNQALLAAKAGATYVSPFVGRLDDIDYDGIKLVEEIADIFNKHAIPTLIIAASIRSSLHVSKVALAGADIATIPYDIILKMIEHPLTNQGIEKFLKDWEKLK